MKKIFFVLFFIPLLALSQNPSKNYSKSIIYKNPSTGAITAADTIVTVNYFDNIGRPQQTVAAKAGGNQQDIVTPFVYDEQGKQTKQYLPYANSTQTVSSLNYRDNNMLISNINSYYTAKYPQDIHISNPNPYSQVSLEESPLAKPLKQAAPGKDWAIESAHTIKMIYDVNDDNAYTVYNFTVNYDNENFELPQLQCSGYFSQASLYVTTLKDENWISGKDKTTLEYTDKQGKVVLKKAFESGIEHDTYYVYDRYSNLSFVLPPKALDNLVSFENGTYVINENTLNTLCYQYRYDKRNRLVEKKLPGKGWEYIVYDKLERPVLIQDAKQRAQNKWLFTKYDRFNRVVYTGEYLTNKNRALLQENMDNLVNPELSETRATSTFFNGGLEVHYTNNAFPNSEIKLLTVNYYDDYNFYPDNTLIPTSVYNAPVTTHTKSLATGSYTRILPGSNWTETEYWITNITAYDEKARPVFQHTDNPHYGYKTTILLKLDFRGKVLETTTEHTKKNTVKVNGVKTTSWLPTTIIDYYTYDHAERPLVHSQKINNNPLEILSSNRYDELGQLTQQEVGGEAPVSGQIQDFVPLQNIDYTYNIRGWLTGINDLQNLNGDLFAFKLSYNNPTEGGIPLYNGNISQTFWKTANDNQLRNYNYDYDALNRIKSASFYNADDPLQNSSYNLSSVNYDKNGNITFLHRQGDKKNAPGQDMMDYMQYSYNGNQLLKISESGSNSTGFTSLSPDIPQQYHYDENGNMIKDLNKGIGQSQEQNIEYNHLDLPVKISFSSNKYIEYVYDAVGTKLEKRVTEYPYITSTLYFGGFIYQQKQSDVNAILQFVSNPQGYAQPLTGKKFEYIYNHKDHLGNIRVSYKGTKQLIASGTFDTSAEGFQSKGDASLSFDSGALIVTTANDYGGVIKSISNTAAVGQRYHFQFTLDRASTENVRVFITETNPANGQWTEHLVGMLAAGEQTLKFDYTVLQYPVVKLQVDRIYSGSAPVSSSFKLLDFKAYSISTTILEESNYYPFGMKHQGYNNVVTSTNIAQKYRFNGKEWQEEFQLNVTAMDYRQYDNVIGRFNSIDAIADLAPDWTPYRFGFNNPILFSDSTGLWERGKNGEWYTNDPDDIARFMDMLFIEEIERNGASIAQIDIFISEEWRGTGGRSSNGVFLLTSVSLDYISGQMSGLSEREVSQIQTEILNFTSHWWNEKSWSGHSAFYNYSYYRERSWTHRGGGFNGLLFGQEALNHLNKKIFNDKTWFSFKKMKNYGHNFHGNQYTGKRITSKNISKFLNSVSDAISVYGLYNTYEEYKSGKLSKTGALFIGALDGTALASKNPYIGAASLGVGLGKEIVESNWYYNAVHDAPNW